MSAEFLACDEAFREMNFRYASVVVVDPTRSTVLAIAATTGQIRTVPTIQITPGLAIDESEVSYAFARAGGPGGQNVNKVESAVHLRFDVFASPSLDEGTKRRLARLAGRKLTQDGVLVIFAQSQRSQERNRDDALARLTAMIAEAAVRPKFRVKTRPSLTAKQKRTDTKVKRGETKRLRGRPVD